ncbi:hypothetical protein N9L80_01760 [Luminiphilus sp.]|nr:hypothetical protein [Luminiphilus sp.]
MTHRRAIDQYLAQYALLPMGCPVLRGEWQHVMVLPCFDESPGFIHRFVQAFETASVLLIVVINRPASSVPEVNQSLKEALATLPTRPLQLGYDLHEASRSFSLLSIDLEALEGATPNDQGVGRARRVGCDVALTLIDRHTVSSPWIYSTDADTEWDASLLTRTWPSEASAVSLPFTHRATDDPAISHATLIYELTMHHYVLHLQAIGSPYAFHTLGSSCVINSHAYAAVRGMPLRNAAEDFYLLNKLAKVGSVHCASGAGVSITSRQSNRVPFGTGPAVEKLMAATDPCDVPLFYHANCFAVLEQLLQLFRQWSSVLEADTQRQLVDHLGNAIGTDLDRLLNQWDYRKAIRHIHNAGKSDAARQHHTHTWFDGFRLLKIIHLLRDHHFPNLTLNEAMRAPDQWPVSHGGTPSALRDAIYQHFGWTG